MSEALSPDLPDLIAIGTMADDDIPLAETALALSHSYRNARSMQLSLIHI